MENFQQKYLTNKTRKNLDIYDKLDFELFPII